MSGVFGISGHKEASRLAYFGLYALQHRGQECTGIASYDGQETHVHIGAGLVPDVYQEKNLLELTGDFAIGHIRYGSAENRGIRSALPLSVRMQGNLNLSIVQDGKIINACVLRAELVAQGAIFQGNTDSEILLHLISHRLSTMSLEEAILDSCQLMQGAYNILFLANEKLIAVRDPHGFHPLLIGRVPDENHSYVFASESCAFDLLEAEFIRDVLPGEMVVVNQSKLTSYRFGENTPVRQCIFELVYFARPDSTIFGENVYQSRKRMGHAMVKESPQEVDCVIPFPDSGIYAAMGAAQEANVPYEHALIRNHYVGRTFIQPTQSMREFSVRVKINPVHSAIENAKLMVVDDSIVRGTTVRTRVAKLRQIGAKEVHFRVSSPPVKNPCHYGVDFPSRQELVAVHQDAASLQKELGLDSLHYLTLDGLKNTVSCPDCYCYACFDGVYPTEIPECSKK